MRDRAVLARPDDRRERGVRGAKLAHSLVRREHDLALGASHDPSLEGPLVDLVREPRRLRDRLQLLLVLRSAQALHQASRLDQVHPLAGELDELAEALDARVGIVVADAAA